MISRRHRRIILAAFIGLAIAQYAVPISMINKRQSTLEQGVTYKFRIGPVDPYDPFLGRYLALDLEAATFNNWRGEPLQAGQTLYAVLEQDKQGFARVITLSMDPPGTRDYLKARVVWQSGSQVRLRLPFDRYYLEENAAQTVWQMQRSNPQQAVPVHIVVKLQDGFGVLEELYFDDKPIFEYMQEQGLWPPLG